MTKTSERAAAKARGDKYYETGRPCKHGHIAPRATLTGTCTMCTDLASRQWKEKNPEKAAAYVAAYRDRNPDKVKANDRRTLAERRRADPEKYRQYRLQHYRNKAAAEGREVRDLNRTPIQEVVARLQEVHAGKLQYVSGYTSMTTNALFFCTLHEKTAYAHPHNVLRGAIPCSECNHMRSDAENAVASFVARFTTAQQRNRQLIRPRELDIYMPEKQMAVEFCGDYWHSHGNKEDEVARKNRHHEKYLACKNLGIRLLTIYESEWAQRNYAIRRLLRNALGRSRGKLMARKCTLGKPTIAQARAFYDRYHPQGGDGSGEHYGLFWKGKLVACMRFSFGINDRGESKNRVWTLSRYATRITVAGAASRLFKAFVEEFNPQEVKSFSDNRYFEGGMYQQLGFALEAELPPDYQVWSPKFGLRPKTLYQRRNIPQRLQEHGMGNSFDPETDPRSESEMTFLMGCRRLYDCGKKRWVWKA